MSDSGQGDVVPGTATTGKISDSRSRVPNRMEELAPGMMVGEYRIEGLLGEGGMGRVYSAMHPVIAKRAAIKILHPELSVNAEAVERFVQEARSVNQIGHPNIVDIFAFGALPDGRSYFVMEWLRGESLRDRLCKSPLPIAASLAVIETISLALEAAHETNVVHRDLKPDNIFLVAVKGTTAPVVKLLDFGIAKLLGTDSDRVEKTRTGNLLGTPAYISPEQARGQYVDARTDIYALGALMYELFTGSLPFPADSAADMIAKHLLEAPPHARIKNPSVPPELDQLIIAMLAKDVNERPTLEQVRLTVQPFRNAAFSQGRPSPYPPMHTPQPQHTPSAPNAYPYQTPSAAYQSYPTGGQHPQTGVAPAVALTTNHDVPAAKSKLPFVLGALLLVGGAAAVVAVALGRGAKPADNPAPKVAPAVVLPAEPPPTPEEPKVIVPDKVETKTEPDVKIEPEPEVKAIEVPAGKKPIGKKPGKKPTGKKPPGDKPVDDDDASM